MQNKKNLTLSIIFIVLFSFFCVITVIPVNAAHTHKYTKLIKTKASTCTTQGYKQYKCKSCKSTKKVYIAKKEHNYKCYKVVDSTCTKTGKYYYECTVCTTKTTKTIDKKSHDWNCYKTVDATCSKTGKQYFKCSVCSGTKSSTIYKKEHYYKLVKTKKPTSTKTGYESYKCTNCSSTHKTTIPKKTSSTTSGNKITLKRITKITTVVKPTQKIYGIHYDNAMLLYNAVLDGKTEIILSFNSKSDEDKFNRLCREYMIDYAYSLRPEEYDMTETVSYKYDIFKISNDIIKEREGHNFAFNSCLKAGLYNGMPQKTAVIKTNAWICKNLKYKVNNKNYYDAFKCGYGQCHAYAQMFEEMCKTANMSVKYVSGIANGGSHAWNKVKIGSTWYWVDVCWNDTGGGSQTEYLLSKTLWSNHKLK